VDVVDLAKLSSYNKGFKYLLTCINVVSRYAWVVPFTDKTGKTLQCAVVKCIETRPPVYLVKDDHGEILEGTFYVEELQKVIKTDDVYKIEPIFKKRNMGQRVQYLVKWLGYPESFSSWILKQDLQKHTTPT
jgi:hypothetical protein